jgi:hypothetical protein
MAKMPPLILKLAMPVSPYPTFPRLRGKGQTNRFANFTLNPDNPLGRRSGEGRKPAIKDAPQSGQNHDVVLLALEFVNQLDTGLRRYDAIFSNGLFGLKINGYP